MGRFAKKNSAWRLGVLLLMIVGTALSAWVIWVATPSIVDRWVVPVFAGYAVLLAGTLFWFCFCVSALLSPRIRAGFTLGALFGASPNLLVWFRWIVIPRDSLIFGIIARFTWIPGAPGILIPRLWGENMLLHNPHFSKEVSLWQWTVLTAINVITWSVIGSMVAALCQRWWYDLRRRE